MAVYDVVVGILKSKLHQMVNMRTLVHAYYMLNSLLVGSAQSALDSLNRADRRISVTSLT